MSVTKARLHELLDYDPGTGAFTWRKAPGKRTELVGRTAGFDSHGYVFLSIDYQKYPAHRVAWFYVYGRWPRDEIDHINRIRSDNRIVNLREATHHQNTCNGPPRRTSKSGLIGVSWDSGTGQWRAHITVAGRTRHLGRFDSITEATVARQAAARAQFGDFAPQART